MLKIKKTKNELVVQFNEQLEKIKLFCKIYDGGDKSIVSDLTVKFRVLFHETESSHSLFKQLKLNHMKFSVSSRKYDVKDLQNHVGLCAIVFSDPDMIADFSPILSMDDAKKVDFNNWWKGEKILVTKDRSQVKTGTDGSKFLGDLDVFTRRKIILAIANTDGGAHVAKELLKDYYDLKNNFNYGLAFSNVTKANEVGNPHILEPIRPTIRQIAAEILNTFEGVDILKESRLR